MAVINADTPLVEVAATVSNALSAAGVTAVLSGGAAISIYTDNRYQSVDLDFVSSAAMDDLGEILGPLGYERGAKGRARYFEHADSRWFVEFPPGPVAVGNRIIGPEDWHAIDTVLGQIQILSPTQMVMDRLAAYFYWHDGQSWDQAVLLALCQSIDWDELKRWVEEEGIPAEEFARFERLATQAP